MPDSLREEQARVIAEATRTTDAERRSWPFTVSLIISNLGFALATLVPHADRIFGHLETWRALFILSFGMSTALIGVWLSKRYDSESRLRRGLEFIESQCLYTGPLLFIYFSRVAWSPLWALCPFSAIYFARTKPFHRSMYLSIIALAHGLATALFAREHQWSDALMSTAMGLGAAAIFELVARRRRSEMLLEAEKNVLLKRFNVATLEAEHERIAQTLADGVARRLATLSAQLLALGPTASFDSVSAARRAENARFELMEIASTSRASSIPTSWAELAAIIEAKCRGLALSVEYEQRLTGSPRAPIEARTALAALRIVQELVRNAVTHASANVLTVGLHHSSEGLELTVRDDGSGLSNEQFERGTGGLHNARSWSTEQGGTLHRQPSDAGTMLVVRLPAPSSRPEY